MVAERLNILLQQLHVCCHSFLFHHLETDLGELSRAFFVLYFILYWSLFTKLLRSYLPVFETRESNFS